MGLVLEPTASVIPVMVLLMDPVVDPECPGVVLRYVDIACWSCRRVSMGLTLEPTASVIPE